MTKRTLMTFVMAAGFAVSGAACAADDKPAETAAPAPAAAPAAAPANVHAPHAEKKFKTADTNGDGMLDDAELRAEAAKWPAPAGTAPDAHFQTLKALIMAADTNADGKISQAEYMTWATSDSQ